MNGIIYILIAFIASTLCGFLTIPAVLDFCKSKGLYDIPNTRKIHKNSIPRLGGVVFLPCMFAGFFAVAIISPLRNITSFTFSLWTVYFMAGIALIYFTGLVDDLVGLHAKTKLIIQLITACSLPLSGLWLNNLQGFLGIHELSFAIGALLTVVAVTLICNAINLIDGIDGLASLLTILFLLGFSIAFYYWGLFYYTVIIAALIGVLVAYTYFNVFGDEKRNHKIFMGDTGSLSLGFLLAFFSLKFSMINPAIIPFPGNGFLLSLTLLTVPIYDVFRVAAVRLTHHKSPFYPDKNHIHHKLMRAGLTQHQALIVILLLALLFIGVNMLLNCFLNITLIIAIDIALYTVFHLILNWRIIQNGEHPTVA